MDKIKKLYIGFQGIEKYDRVTTSFEIDPSHTEYDYLIDNFVRGLSRIVNANIYYAGYKAKGACFPGYPFSNDSNPGSMSMSMWRLQTRANTTRWQGQRQFYNWYTKQNEMTDRFITGSSFIPFADLHQAWPGANSRWNDVLPTSQIWTDFMDRWQEVCVIRYRDYHYTGLEAHHQYVFPASTITAIEWRISFPKRFTKAVIKGVEERERTTD